MAIVFMTTAVCYRLTVGAEEQEGVVSREGCCDAAAAMLSRKQDVDGQAPAGNGRLSVEVHVPDDEGSCLEVVAPSCGEAMVVFAASFDGQTARSFGKQHAIIRKWTERAGRIRRERYTS
ncbi:MAG: hypothetical protein P4L84_35920 [Isosphaeraceae bacterium]|nr:hypothetical protein [Isosphaeraceae bacterium]